LPLNSHTPIENCSFINQLPVFVIKFGFCNKEKGMKKNECLNFLTNKQTNEIEIEHLKEQEFQEFCLLSESPQLLQL
jgi:hypothetical protein